MGLTVADEFFSYWTNVPSATRVTWLLQLFLLLFIRSPGLYTDFSCFGFYTRSSFGFPKICLNMVTPPILTLRFCIFCSFFYCKGHKQRNDTYFYLRRLLFFPIASFSHPDITLSYLPIDLGL